MKAPRWLIGTALLSSVGAAVIYLAVPRFGPLDSRLLTSVVPLAVALLAAAHLRATPSRPTALAAALLLAVPAVMQLSWWIETREHGTPLRASLLPAVLQLGLVGAYLARPRRPTYAAWAATFLVAAMLLSLPGVGAAIRERHPPLTNAVVLTVAALVLAGTLAALTARAWTPPR